MRAPYIDSGDTRLCTGCSACVYACPTGAVTMVEEDCGFVYPAVDEDRCIDCGKCLRACHMAASDELKSKGEPEAYGAYVTDRDQLMRSASGGVASAIALKAIEEGGVAYGCVADREDVRHLRLSTKADVERSRGSKYVQSDMSGAIPQIAADLDAGVCVAFVGTPCQCAALRRLFGDRGNLLLVDLVCEGVPSRRIYADFLDDLERERGERVTDFRFRDKRGGWSTKNAVVVGEGGTLLDRQPHSYCYSYYWLFAHALILRDSCYACPYACKERVGDVTVGDFWGAESAGLGYSLEELRDGISCVVVNTSQGRDVAAEIANVCNVRACEPGVIARCNACLEQPSRCALSTRNDVLKAFRAQGSKGLKDAYKEYYGLKLRAKEFLSSHLPLSVRVAIKRAVNKRG